MAEGIPKLNAQCSTLMAHEAGRGAPCSPRSKANCCATSTSASRKRGDASSFDEMKDALDLRSKSGIHRLIMALEERGFIRRLPNRARALEVLRLPECSTPSTPRPGKFEPSVIRRQSRQGPGRSSPAIGRRESQSSAIPVMGRIAAGTPISALQSRSHSIALPPDLLGNGEHYALEVRGDSMIEAGNSRRRYRGHQETGHREIGRHRRRADRRGGGDAEAAAQAQRLHRAGSRQSRLRNPNFGRTASASRAG